jgi:hypothetical protein
MSDIPVWQGWHALRSGLATNLHALGIADKGIQATLRHGNIAVTQSCHIKALTKSQVSAMDLVGEEFRTVILTSGENPDRFGPYFNSASG